MILTEIFLSYNVMKSRRMTRARHLYIWHSVSHGASSWANGMEHKFQEQRLAVSSRQSLYKLRSIKSSGPSVLESLLPATSFLLTEGG
jgi:hypothetical protein